MVHTFNTKDAKSSDQTVVIIIKAIFVVTFEIRSLF